MWQAHAVISFAWGDLLNVRWRDVRFLCHVVVLVDCRSTCFSRGLQASKHGVGVMYCNQWGLVVGGRITLLDITDVHLACS
jgi:hypothetical protein